MAAGWVKSLQCKSRAFEDVYHPIPKPPLLPSTSCRNSYQNLKDVVIDHSKPKPKPKPKPKIKPDPDSSPSPHKRTPQHRRSGSVRPKPESPPDNNKVRRTLSAPISKGGGLDPVPGNPFFPSVSELQEGHPSRNVVEIIFQTRWGPKGFAGRVEMVFKIQNMPRTLSRFEEYRDTVKSRAGKSDTTARCSADGNEMMRFRCLGPTTGHGGTVINSAYCGGICPSVTKGSSNTTSCWICTYSGSGMAHESAGGGRGRRAMLVCRVIAGRVSKRAVLDGAGVGDSNSEFDSVSGENGELLVFDNRAVLPCFLVIYKL